MSVLVGFADVDRFEDDEDGSSPLMPLVVLRFWVWVVDLDWSPPNGD